MVAVQVFGRAEVTVHGLDFSSWQSLLATLASLALVALVGVGIRLVAQVTIQQRRERANRQINERLRTLIAAYKALGGSFTGNLVVDPRHLRDLRTSDQEAQASQPLDLSAAGIAGSDRARRIRDAVEAALSDIILLGTDDQVRLASIAAGDLVAGRPVRTHDLVVSLRNFIRKALDLDPIPAGLIIPPQGPSRPSGSSGKGKAEGGERERGAPAVAVQAEAGWVVVAAAEAGSWAPMIPIRGTTMADDRGMAAKGLERLPSCHCHARAEPSAATTGSMSAVSSGKEHDRGHGGDR